MEFDWIPRVNRETIQYPKDQIYPACVSCIHPQSFNIKPENDAFQKNNLLFQGVIFSGSMLTFRVVYTLNRPVVFFMAQWLHHVAPAPKKPGRAVCLVVKLQGCIWFLTTQINTSVGCVWKFRGQGCRLAGCNGTLERIVEESKSIRHYF